MIPSMMMNDPFFRHFEAALPLAVQSLPASGTPGSRLTHTQHYRDIPVDLKEVDGAFELHADIPGVTKDNIKVEVNDDVLTISVEQNASNKSSGVFPSDPKPGDEDSQAPAKDGDAPAEPKVRWYREERSSSFASRRVRMPEAADLMSLSAAYADGVLSVRVPKTEVASKHKRITVA